MEFDFKKLRIKIFEVCERQEVFAKKIGMSYVSLNKRLNNHLEFSTKEIRKCCEVLGIKDKDIPVYFFTLKVQKHEQEIA
jgi:hypothetical protein